MTDGCCVFSYFYTHRTNCVEQIGVSTLPLDTKIAYCEEAYQQWGTPSIFKISPLLPESFDALLEQKGYVREHTTHVMTMSLEQLAEETSSHSGGCQQFYSRFLDPGSFPP